MARLSLLRGEVAMIKAMLRRGMRNNEIQFYFNRPDRPVNSGRITEIRKNLRWSDVEPASPDELDSFLKRFGSPSDPQLDPDSALPDQFPAAAVFHTDEAGRIAIVADPPGTAPESDPEQAVMYKEMRQKAESILSAGHNLLGALREPLQRFHEALPEDMMSSSMTTIWFRGNALRSILRAHDQVKESGDMHPEKLDPAYGERLRDVVESFNIFVLGDPKGIRLDSQRLGPTDREAADAVVRLAVPIAERATEVATYEVSSLLEEQTESATAAPRTVYGDQAVAVAQQTSSNFVLALTRGALRSAKRMLGGEFSAAWSNYKVGIYTAAGALTVAHWDAVLAFVVHHFDLLSAFAVSALRNPIVVQVLEFIAKAFG